MNSKIYRQADPDWGNLPYPTKNYIFARNACGCVSVNHVAIENPKYKDLTPKQCRKFMVQYARCGMGTLHIGIVKGMEHYGYNVHWRHKDSMSTIFTTLKQSLKRGVLLFGKKKGPDGTVWTTSGHYISFVDYKVKKNGTHWFYLKDSGGRHHDGWWCYEKSMRYDIKEVFIATSYASVDKEVVDNKYEKVIDISYAQSKALDWKKVKADGIDGVIVRCGYRGYGSGKLKEDDMYMTHIKGAQKEGLKLGVYMFTEGITKKEGEEEAQFAIDMLSKAHIVPDYPIAVDTEFITPVKGQPAPRANALSKSKRTSVVKAFCKEIKALGFKPMIYASTNWLNTKLEMKKLPYLVWVAQYYNEVTYKGDYIMWQYTSDGRVDGATGRIDLNKWYGKKSKPKNSPKVTPTKPVQKLLEVGSTIKIKKGACQYGKSSKFSDFVYDTKYKVVEIKGSRVVFAKGGTVIGAVSKNDCIVQ